MKRVPGFDYLPIYATEDGRVFNDKGEKKTFICKRKGYALVSHTVSRGKSRLIPVHQLVCAAFHGLRPPNKTVTRHLDGNPKNNSAQNLCWGTPSENTADAVKHRTNSFFYMSDDIRRANGKASAIKQVIAARGYSFHKYSQKWKVAIVVNKKPVSLGYFSTEAEAIIARAAAVKLYLHLKKKGIL